MSAGTKVLSAFRKLLLAKQLNRSEVAIVLAVMRAEEKRAAYHAGRLGIAQSLVNRNWLVRNDDGLWLSQATRELLEEFQHQEIGG